MHYACFFCIWYTTLFKIVIKLQRIIHKNASINLQSCPVNLATWNSLADNNKIVESFFWGSDTDDSTCLFNLWLRTFQIG